MTLASSIPTPTVDWFAMSPALTLLGASAVCLLVAVQMTTALRPIIGTADTILPTQKQFFVSHWGDCLKAPAGESKSSGRD